MRILILFLLINLINSFNLLMIDHLPTIKEVIRVIPYSTRTDIVEYATGILPQLDFFGSLVLETNEKIIDNILRVDFLTEEQAKVIILKIIELCREGDKMGSKILLNYYNLIDYIL